MLICCECLLTIAHHMIKVTSNISVNETEIKYSFIRASGPGGQNVNKVATATQLRFNVINSPSLPDEMRARLLALIGKKLNAQGDLIIKAGRFRTQERNKQDALERLLTLLRKAAVSPKKRKKTKPTLASTERRLTKKKLHSKNKLLRSKKELV